MAGSSKGGTGSGNRLLIHCWISSLEGIINEGQPSELDRLPFVVSGAGSSSRRSIKFAKKMFET